jgi:hypothetical protein
LGADGTNAGEGIAVDSTGSAYVTGFTNSPGFPTANPIQGSLAGFSSNAFIARLDPAGSAFVYSTFLGGKSGSNGSGIAVDSSGNAYVTGGGGPDFPTVNPIFTSAAGGAFVAKIAGPPGPGPQVALSTRNLNFGSELQGATSSIQTVTLMNIGADSLAIASITVSGDFALASTRTSCPYTGGSVASESVCTLDVTFTPLTNGVLTGLLTVNDNANDTPQTVTLTGTGVTSAPLAVLSPATLVFAPQWYKSASPPQPVTLSNTGNAELAISGVGISGNFLQTNDCGSSVAAGASCTIEVAITPAAYGAISGTLTLRDNSNGEEASMQSVELSGTGVDFTLSGGGASFTVEPGWTALYTLSAAGLGGFNQNVSFTCSGAPAGASCTFSPNPVTVGSAQTYVNVRVTTTASSSSLPRLRMLFPIPPLSPGSKNAFLLFWLLVAVAWAARRRKQWRRCPRSPAIAPLALGLWLTLALAACGGVSPETPNSGTPLGTYTLNVQGTAGSGASTVSHNVTLTLIVT